MHVVNGIEFMSIELEYGNSSKKEVEDQFLELDMGTVLLVDGDKRITLDTGQRHISHDGFSIIVDIVEHTDIDKSEQTIKVIGQRYDTAEVYIGEGYQITPSRITLYAKQNGCTICIDLEED